MKNILRKKYKKIRNNISDKWEKDQSIQSKIIQLLNKYNKCNHIGLFYSINNEPQILEVYTRLENIKFYLPKVLSKNNDLIYTKLSIPLQFEKDYYNINASINTKDEDLDLVFIPGIAFNENGYRLGYGSGCYDLYFRKHNLIKVGICYEECLINIPFQEDHDIKMDYIITEERIIKVNNDV